MEFEEFNYATKPGHIAYIPLTRHTRFETHAIFRLTLRLLYLLRHLTFFAANIVQMAMERR